ncbi:MAG: ATP-binding cassette domain-containing protein, partial [Thermodesulfobacteriota bacterium]
MTTDQFILDTECLNKAFGGLMAISDLSFKVREGEIKSVIGPNGAGKTTLFNLITGVHPASSGSIHFRGKAINGLKPHVIAGLGISRTFQTVELFPQMTVLENVMVGCHPRSRAGLFSSGLRLPSMRKEEKWIRDESIEKLELGGLLGKAELPAGSLPWAYSIRSLCRARPTTSRRRRRRPTACSLGSRRRIRACSPASTAIRRVRSAAAPT